MKQLRNLILILIVIALSFGTGYRTGSKRVVGSNIAPSQEISGKNPTKITTQKLDFSLFWDVWDRIAKGFINKKNIDSQKMIYGAISGMVASLGDPYTVFLPPDQNKEAKDDLGGHFEGIGAQLGVKDKKIVVIAPLKDSPADKSGLKPGDWIVKVDGQETLDWTLPQAVNKIRGAKGSDVLLSILHRDASKTADIKVTRDTIKVLSVEFHIKPDECGNGDNPPKCKSVAYLRLSQFGDKTADEWNKAVDEIIQKLADDKNHEIKGLVLDFRNNPGGYLTGAVFIASEFLKDGAVFIQEFSDGRQQSFSVNRQGRLLDIPMVVLINKGSASASEIVAGALQDRLRAKLIGETSFGKGSIQEAQDLSGGAGVHITVAKWLVPSGKWINGEGITPDVKIENDDSKPEVDLQLQKAVEMLLK
ncbi:S41 family peptidase [Candidatus Gottesmanbacteria bacterium]|nr:S41 family peptidase [Candidatus Gottesmanbacteria bacterium]